MVFLTVFLNRELSVYWHNISDMEIELGCMPACFFLGGLYDDNVRTMSMTAAQVMMSTLFGLVCWRHNGMVVDRLRYCSFSQRWQLRS